MILPLLVLTYLSSEAFTQDLTSPCPSVFRYEPQTEKGRWYGVIFARTGEDLTGVWLTIVLDSQVELIGNWFGESSSSDNQEFRIANPDYILQAGPPVSIRFFVKYDKYQSTPRLQSIRLNGKTICSEDSSDRIGPTTPKLHISVPKTHRPSVGSAFSYDSNNHPHGNNDVTTINRPNHSNNFNGARDDDNETTRKPSGSSNGSGHPSRGSGSHNNNNKHSVGYEDSNYDQDSRSREPNSHSNRKPVNDQNKISVGTSTENRDVDRYGSSNGQDGTSYSDEFHRATTERNRVTKRPQYDRTTERYNNNEDREETGHLSLNRPTSSGQDTFGSNFNDNSLQQGGSDESYGVSSKRPTSSNHYQGNSDRSRNKNDSDEDYFQGDFNIHRPTFNNDNSHTNPSALGTGESVACGTVASIPRPLITNGQDTVPGEWPWHAAIYHTKGIQLVYICGGSLISEKYVLTAAHCVTKARSKKIVEPDTLLIYLGKYNLKTFGPETQDRDVSDIYIHPDYNYTTFYNDIAILKLNRLAKITDYVRPCCLWEGDTNLENVVGQPGTVIGWGFDENKKISEKLMQAKMPIVSTIQCIYSNRDFFARFTFDKNFCAGYRNETSVCNGDSGGSLVFPRRGTSGHSTVWQIRGLVSVGVALQSEGVCDSSQYVIFTDVAKHLSWINRMMRG